MPVIIEKMWYGRHPLYWLLLPLTLIYQLVIIVRRFYLTRFKQEHFPVPIIVVGNLTVGGVGKTPLVISLAKQLQQKGLRVGIVSRGYGASIKSFPYEVNEQCLAKTVGDEPLLIARRTGCPVVIAPQRNQAINYLLANYRSQVIISDDGLQHYAMGRSIEVVVIDGLRGVGNGQCLPAGPLREPIRRLRESDIVVVNGSEYFGAFQMKMEPGQFTQLNSGREIDIESLNTPVAAVAGIGHPQRFFSTLKQLGVKFNAYPFPDHHIFSPDELDFPEKMIVMTEKDAVKCQEFAGNDWYFLPIEAKLSDAFWQKLWAHEQLKDIANETS